MEQSFDQTLDVVRVQIEGVTASFRYPHFLIGRQPTYPMPPPATVYGIISGALGRYPDPTSIRFAYRFECERERTDDLETIWFVEPNTATRGPSKDFNLNATSNVLPREWLIYPRMTLYIAAEDLESLYRAFREPRYVPCLGRTQDLVSYKRVDYIRMIRPSDGHLGPALISQGLRQRVKAGPTVHMPRYIQPENRWEVHWDWFIALNKPIRIDVGAHGEFKGGSFWADPSANDVGAPGASILEFHHFLIDG